ncbi:related to COG3602 family protein [Cephalotrichum gorgonifer]|uniref:Related to COG3602 family protein n=1 Tax=Cephalotrichum gorgonifer TaxID=2041049 RepID=A0AAE8N1P7_9PEZI|nr:related to COG3602 family protein [Cephalotrichum gorgonifer]
MANTAPPGETSLQILLSSLTTSLHPSTFVFATISSSAPLPPPSEIQAMFRETEGVTVVTTIEYATESGLEFVFPCRMIQLNVQSSLEAVGFMAVVATNLAAGGIATNPISGFYHDHIFVPVGKEREAVELLEEVARGAGTVRQAGL